MGDFVLDVGACSDECGQYRETKDGPWRTRHHCCSSIAAEIVDLRAKLERAVGVLEWFMPLIREDYDEARAMSGDYSTREFGTWVLKAAAVLEENKG